jgi:hypothetical protein
MHFIAVLFYLGCRFAWWFCFQRRAPAAKGLNAKSFCGVHLGVPRRKLRPYVVLNRCCPYSDELTLPVELALLEKKESVFPQKKVENGACLDRSRTHPTAGHPAPFETGNPKLEPLCGRYCNAK